MIVQSVLFISLTLILTRLISITLFQAYTKVLLIFVFFFFFCAVTLKGCDREYEYELAKHKQWKYERENNLPYTSYGE